MRGVFGQDKLSRVRCRPKGVGERAISRDEFDAPHQGGDVDTHRYRIPLTHHNTHSPRVNDDLMWNAIIDVEDGCGVVEQDCSCVCLRHVLLRYRWYRFLLF